MAVSSYLVVSGVLPEVIESEKIICIRLYALSEVRSSGFFTCLSSLTDSSFAAATLLHFTFSSTSVDLGLYEKRRVQ